MVPYVVWTVAILTLVVWVYRDYSRFKHEQKIRMSTDYDVQQCMVRVNVGTLGVQYIGPFRGRIFKNFHGNVTVVPARDEAEAFIHDTDPVYIASLGTWVPRKRVESYQITNMEPYLMRPTW